jgi:hypothetical protein
LSSVWDFEITSQRQQEYLQQVQVYASEHGIQLVHVWPHQGRYHIRACFPQGTFSDFRRTFDAGTWFKGKVN